MRFYNLGAAPWEATNALTGALAAMRREAIVLTRPQPPVLCVGEQVNLQRVVDLGMCRAHGVPIVPSHSRTRAMCFAQTQLELRLIIPHDRRPMEEDGTQTYYTILSPFLESCRDLGIEAEFNTPDEIVIRGRRVGLACKRELDGCTIISAGLAVEFDANAFAELLNVPDVNVRARVVELVHARRTSLKEELCALPPPDALEERVCAHMRRISGGNEPGIIDQELRTKMQALAPEQDAPGLARRPNRANGDWDVDIGAGTDIQQRSCRAPGGVIRATCEWHNSRIVNAALSGDFLCYPPGCLQRFEASLVGLSIGQVAARVCDFYRLSGWVTPGIQPGHWARVLLPLSLEDYTPLLPASPDAAQPGLLFHSQS